MSTDKLFLGGYIFENSIMNIALKYSNVKVFHNFRLYSVTSKGNVEIDILIVTKKNIYSIECKKMFMLKGESYHKYWTTRTDNGLIKFKSPILQNLNHVRSLATELRLIGSPRYSIKNIICVPHKCRVYSTYDNIYTDGDLESMIRKDCFSVYPNHDVNEVISNLLKIRK